MPEQSKNLPDLRSDFDQGASVAMDPVNNTAIHRGGQGITTLNSYWLHQYCPVCSHTFRLGDTVEIANDGTVRHNSPLLPCSQTDVTKLDFSEQSSAFFMGLDTTCPPPKDMPIARLNASHHLLNPPLAGFQRHTCVVCSHTFRQNDRVVICPCSPHEPLCKIAVHRDIIHGLNCLEAWNPGFNGQRYCPVTSKKLDE
ncbi:hypothetical protein G7B40_033330 [Aetokthonos hydrillicola Thurmond2011]|jgi:hypothetical protein|uniref:Uncharacterized protein n=1 Tax=Aetokthonos hydrillicola Thurmond2011 TaxID=2712845 RepID=A0AAP5IDV1_9CYAN|nr:hypothetical protein [Aetokthonos hydrillicola]MBO3459555.1 hypothetical protein [Aetokthonos hydrillicola CCALA 1050]MBW4590305.1 hypothetical protein [Aetokthonos hydrillicola CCALA 1050]MDR9899407.1 hypothetical protein [Aetokthonos hydrillicola Thurmond2011]